MPFVTYKSVEVKGTLEMKNLTNKFRFVLVGVKSYHEAASLDAFHQLQHRMESHLAVRLVFVLS